MRNCFVTLAMMSALVAFTMDQTRAAESTSESDYDIRYRSILYFYPPVDQVDTSQLSKAFKPFEIVKELPPTSLKPVVSYSVVTPVQDVLPVPDMKHLAYFGRGLDKEQAERIQKSKVALVIDVAYPQTMRYAGLKIASAALFNIASSTDSVIWDSETRELFTPKAWKEKRIDTWDGDIPNIEHQIVIHAYKTEGGVRAISLGMAKLGLPDIVVNNFSWGLNRSVGNLVTLVAQSIAEGFVPNKDGMLELVIDKLKDTQYKKKLVASLKENAVPKVDMLLGNGKWEEGDPDNALIEIRFENLTGNSLSEKQENLLSSLFGWEDQIAYVKHNALIEAASQRAKQKLNGLRKDFNDGLAPGEFIHVKAPFQTPEGGTEWMWVEVMSWQGGTISGLLKNEPYNIPSLKGGSEVVVKQEDIFDYLRYFPDGTSEGNETGALIMKYQQ